MSPHENGNPHAGQKLDTKNMGNLGLTPAEVADIVAFMEMLTDGS